jgi:DNA-binding NtrC family response regulator
MPSPPAPPPAPPPAAAAAAGASPAAPAVANAATLTLHRARVPGATTSSSSRGEGHSLTGDHLLIIELDSSAIYELPTSGELLIGRAPDVQIRLRDPSASRVHARLAVTSDGIYISDLGSYNGTRVNGERISSATRLQPGDSIAICDVILLYRRRSPAALLRPIHGSLSPLRERLDEELERALSGYGALSVMCIELSTPSDAASPIELPLASLAEKLGPQLRAMDAVARDGHSRLFVLLPDRAGPDTLRLGQALLPGLLPILPALRIGYASFPEDSSDAASLLAAAQAAAGGAVVGTVAGAGAAVTRLRVGEHEILLADAAMLRLYSLLERLAQSELPVLIHGETGTGKELAAQVLHGRSPRRDKRLVSINCAALPESLAESELFGHERGAFSGAVASKQGLLEAASGGTVFFDEVGELPLSLQAKLLRVLETKRLLRVGDTRERPVDVRIVAATNRRLEDEIKAGRFRQDLYFRLASAVVVLPPLRERPRELPILARAFLAQAGRTLGREALLLAPTTLERLLRYGWPGNVRELKNAMDYAAAVVTDVVVEPEALPPAILSATPGSPKDEAAPFAGGTSGGPLPTSLSQLARAILRLEASDKLLAIEEALVTEALALADGNKSAAARLLGVHRKVVERRLAREPGST